MKKADRKLVLEDGQVYYGYGFGKGTHPPAKTIIQF